MRVGIESGNSGLEALDRLEKSWLWFSVEDLELVNTKINNLLSSANEASSSKARFLATRALRVCNKRSFSFLSKEKVKNKIRECAEKILIRTAPLNWNAADELTASLNSLKNSRIWFSGKDLDEVNQKIQEVMKLNLFRKELGLDLVKIQNVNINSLWNQKIGSIQSKISLLSMSDGTDFEGNIGCVFTEDLITIVNQIENRQFIDWQDIFLMCSNMNEILPVQRIEISKKIESLQDVQKKDVEKIKILRQVAYEMQTFRDLRKDFDAIDRSIKNYEDNRSLEEIKLKENLSQSINEHKQGKVFYEQDFSDKKRVFSSKLHEYNQCHQQAFIDFAELELIDADPVESLVFSMGVHESKKPLRKIWKPTEDAYCYSNQDSFVIAGVFDGHGGHEVSYFVSKKIPLIFNEKMQAPSASIYTALLKTVKDILSEVAQHQEWMNIGSTGVISVIEKATNLIYTATLGDSEANIYREISGNDTKSIPLSLVRDFSNEEEFTRALKTPGIKIEYHSGAGDDYFLHKLSKNYNPQGLYCCKGRRGVNVSGGFGDMSFGEAISHDPKITIAKVKPGDRLVLVCDGIKNFMPEDKIIEIVKNKETLSKNAAMKLGFEARRKWHSNDDITALFININRESENNT